MRRDRFSDHGAVVTGAGAGIGEAIARELASAGAAVAALDVDENRAQSTADAIRASGGTAVAIKADVTAYEEVEAARDRVTDVFERVDILVNNAGVGATTPFLESTPDEWVEIIDVNLTGAFNCIHVFGPEFAKQAYGRIVNVASMAGRSISYLGAVPYTASKWGLIGLTKHLAWELGQHGVTVNAICPGITETNLAIDEIATDATERVPVGRWGRPADHAEAVRFLAAESAEYVNGAILEIDGGAQFEHERR